MATILSNRPAEVFIRSEDGYKSVGVVEPSASKEAGRSTLNKDVTVGSTSGAKLVEMINKKRFDDASKLLGDMVSEKQDIASSLPTTVLITAVNNNAPVPFLQALINANPDCIRKRDRKGKYALHAAVRCHHAAAAVLIKRFPEALSVKSAKGLMPIHYACRHQAPVCVIEHMAKNVPESLGHLTKLNWTPLHMAVAYHAPDDTISRLCTASAVRVRTLDSKRLPLHIVAVSGCTPKAAQAILSQHPEGAKARDKYGKTPLDYVIDYKRWELSKLFFVADKIPVRPKRTRTYTLSSMDTSTSVKRPRHRISSVSF